MSTSRCLKVVAGSIALMVITSGCSQQEAKSVKGEVNTEYVEPTELEGTTLNGERTLKVEGLKTQFEAEWKAEQERKAKEEAEAKEKAEAERKAKEEAEAKEKAEAERKAKEEAEVKEKAEAERKAKEEAEAKEKAEAEAKTEEEAKEKEQQSTPEGLAQWENENYSDIHERANNSTMGSQFTNDEDYYYYLMSLRPELLMSGEMQWIAAYEQGYLYDNEPVEEETYEDDQTFDE